MKRSLTFLCGFLLALASAALAQESPKVAPPVSGERETTPRNPHAQLAIAGKVLIGDQAPDFELDGSQGAPVLLSKLRGDWILLVFTDRRDQFVPMKSVEPALRESGVRIVGVCHEKARTLDNFSDRASVPLMLADVTGEVAAMYGLWSSGDRRIVPGFLVLDRTGVVRIAFLGHLLPPDEIARLTQFAVGEL